MDKFLIKIENGAKKPKYMTSGSSGMDLYANIEEDIVIKPMDITLVSTGISISIPEQYEIQVRARSGLSLKGITLVNGIGTIDSDYRGEIKVPLINLSKEDFVIKKHDRIAQIVVCKIEKVNFIEKQLDETTRGVGGFGHTKV